ncbi:MAG: hypothetical protein HY328_16905 [Chloroflexi bacterium]|nr:hypothetical protein [Chloroflexota bacterium]
MSSQLSEALQTPSYVVNQNGKQIAVLVDLATWQSILDRLEDQEDFDILRANQAALTALAQGKRPAGWKSWDEFERELDALEMAGELPT